MQLNTSEAANRCIRLNLFVFFRVFRGQLGFIRLLKNYFDETNNCAYKACRYLIQSRCSTGFSMSNLRYQIVLRGFSRFFNKEVNTWQPVQLNGSTTQRVLVLSLPMMAATICSPTFQ